MSTRNIFGVWEASQYEENCSEFNGEVPDWESRLAEHDDLESGNLITESDLEIGDYAGIQSIADWDVFLSLSYVDPMERA